MKQIVFSILIGIMVTLIAAGPALGDIMNTRPYSTAANLNELQTLFNNIGATSIDAFNDQTVYGYFEPMGAGNTSAAYIATVSYSGMPLDFGIYELGDTSNRLDLFSLATSTPGDSVAIVFDYDSVTPANSEVRVIDLGGGGLLDSTTLNGKGYFEQFGFYAYNASSGEGYLYSEDTLNPGPVGKNARFLTYQSEGDDVTIGGQTLNDGLEHWYIAAEAGNYSIYNGNTLDGPFPGDFTDFVVQVESISPVPVPGAVLLGILGLSVAGIKLRKFA